MNLLTIIGNLTRDPELRSTPSGKSVCNFSVAVSRRKKVEGQPDADFFSVSAWNELGENCAKYLAKGRKVAVTGTVSLRMYKSGDHEGASMDVLANTVEFLSPVGNSDSAPRNAASEQTENHQSRGTQEAMIPVDVGDDLPF